MIFFVYTRIYHRNKALYFHIDLIENEAINIYVRAAYDNIMNNSVVHAFTKILNTYLHS